MTFLAQYISNKNLLLHGWAKCYRRPTQYSDHPSRTEYHLLDASPAYRTPLLDRSTVNPHSHCDPHSRVFVLNQYQSHENASCCILQQQFDTRFASTIITLCGVLNHGTVKWRGVFSIVPLRLGPVPSYHFVSVAMWSNALNTYAPTLPEMTLLRLIHASSTCDPPSAISRCLRKNAMIHRIPAQSPKQYEERHRRMTTMTFCDQGNTSNILKNKIFVLSHKPWKKARALISVYQVGRALVLPRNVQGLLTHGRR